MPRAVFATPSTRRARLELTVDDGVPLLDAEIVANVEGLNACPNALEEVRPSVEGVGGHSFPASFFL